ncbi:hypothetical protein LTS08_000901 [Lithohypha guttulata]|uniref:uncharacterized protein n=1 Tax=Lithohypha guttulata TaxID=1690604 RepID=UPI002DE057EB|nr:hypothetical protein LTR51_006483 [Lithohypha guttulata]KAK5106778.1 hypothetical protein LTS08_000901 [Lithohypha guttulata]
MAAEAAQAEVQALLAFLTRDAKVPLAAALPKYNALRKHGLVTPDAIAKADIGILRPIFTDEKILKQVQNAAKRLSNPKKRAASTILSSPTKQRKTTSDHEVQLELPYSDIPIDDLRHKTIETNRAPLFLAFAFCLTKYTLPEQPLSSRLSLAQAVTSAGAQSKAKYIGLTDSTAEDEGWAQGQPKIRLMGRDVPVMRRHVATPVIKEEEDGPETVDVQESGTMQEAFWGIDLEALKKSNGPLVAGKLGGAGPPVHRPEGARAYMLKSIDLVQSDDEKGEHNEDTKPEKPSLPQRSKKLTAADKTARREEAVAVLLKAIDHVYASWSTTLKNDELDRKASSWYAQVRPAVEYGQAGWGQRGKVSLQAIVDLTKRP